MIDSRITERMLITNPFQRNIFRSSICRLQSPPWNPQAPENPLNTSSLDTPRMADDDDDPWGAFGSDDEDDSPTTLDVWIVAKLKQSNPRVQRRYVRGSLPSGLLVEHADDDGYCDVYVGDCLTQEAVQWVLPGGLLVLREEDAAVSEEEWIREDSSGVDGWNVWTRSPCGIQSQTCPWLPSSHSLEAEVERLRRGVICPSAEEIREGRLNSYSISYAVRAMQAHGFCILRRWLPTEPLIEWGQAALNDVHLAAEHLRRHGTDLYHPHQSTREPDSYRELSMREDLRLDIRDGPHVRRLRGPAVRVPLSEADDVLRGNASVQQILRDTMTPNDDYRRAGNWGRHNFGGVPDISVGPVGEIVSLPNSADQALHADTPHLWDHIPDLPAHYINVFAIACGTAAGQTAVVPGSHNLDVTADWERQGIASPLADKVVRPALQVGDVLLFDCRILHFGLANGTEEERAILYTNVTLPWFHDPKNWDDRKTIFEEGDYDL